MFLEELNQALENAGAKCEDGDNSPDEKRDHFWGGLERVSLGTGLDWTGLGWTGLEWTGLDWTGLDWTGMDWNGMDWTGLDWTGLEWTGMDWTGLEEGKGAVDRDQD